MGFARIDISNPFLAEALKMPAGTKFYNGVPLSPDSLGVVVEHEDLTGDIDELPLIKPIYHRIDFDWNQPKEKG
jgi:hypothetical protein